MDLLAELGTADPHDHFSERDLLHGAQYVADDRILYVDLIDRDRSHVEAHGWARGTAGQMYRIRLSVRRAEDGGLEVRTTCTCPVGHQCKHGAGLLLSVRPEAPPAARGWRAELDRLTGAAAPSPRRGLPGVALLIDLEPGYTVRRGPVLTLRPMRPGARQGWVRSGLEWSQVPVAMLERRYDPDQLIALEALRRAASGGSHPLGPAPALHHFGPNVVRLLREARDAGVVLLSSERLPPIDLLDGPAQVGVDVTERPGGAHVVVGLVHEGRFWTGEQVRLSEPPVSAALVGLGEPGTPGERSALVELRPPLTVEVAALVRRADPILVPVAEVPELVERLGLLTRTLPVVSTDRSVVLPELPRPRLRVTVTWHGASLADVHWQWCYGDLAAVDLGTDPADTPGVARDPEAEDAVLAGLDPAPTQAQSTVAGADVLHLALLAMPVWRQTPDVEVLEQDPPVLRETEAAPTISFEAPATDPGHRPEHTDWLDLEVIIRVEGELVPLAHVLEALTLGHAHLVLPSGVYLRLDGPEFTRLAEIVAAAAELHRSPGTGVRVGRRDLGLWAQLSDLGVVDAQAAAWVRRARALRDLVDLPRPEPVGVASTLRGYQLEGFRWLAFLWEHRLGGILADDMGLGKTLQVLALIAHVRAQEVAGTGTGTGPAPGQPFLVVAPTSVVSAWRAEAARHTPGLRVEVVEASRARRTSTVAELARGADVVVTSYALLRIDAPEYAAATWAGVVLDEAQQVKNHQSKAYAAVRGLGAEVVLAVTGTPFENRLMELWSLLSLVAPGLYAQPSTFREAVARPVEREGDRAVLARLTARIKPFVLRRTKELVAADLPPKQEQVVPVELGARHRRLYDAHLAKERQRVLGLVEDDFDRNRVAILAALTRLRQLALDPGLVDPDHDDVGSAKLDVLLERLLEVAAEGHRALVFSQFTSFLRRARERLAEAGLEAEYLDGTTSVGARGRIIDRFREGGAPVFLISLKAGGTGLTLTEADYVFVLDPWWNPAAEAQAVDRAHRIGQTRQVMVYRLVSRDTIEEKVMALKDRKAALFRSVVDGDGGLGTGVTADDVRGLFD